jgi:hypothetical protein
MRDDLPDTWLELGEQLRQRRPGMVAGEFSREIVGQDLMCEHRHARSRVVRAIGVDNALQGDQSSVIIIVGVG